MSSDPCDRLLKESKLAYNAFLEYKDERSLKIAYNNYMQNNPDALTTMKGFVKWASQFDWQKRVNAYDAEQEMFTMQETRRKGLTNALTAETMAQELFASVRDEIELKKGEMTHNDMARYLNICVKINERWVKQLDVPSVTVNVEQNVEQTVKTEPIDPEIAATVGKLLALKESVVVEE